MRRKKKLKKILAGVAAGLMILTCFAFIFAVFA